MWNLTKPPKTGSYVASKPPKGQFFFAERTWERVKWWRYPHMRSLYFYCIILILNNVANGFDGSMMNGLQSLSYWRDYFGDPSGARLGIFSSIMTLGSLAALPFIPPICDKLGRKWGVMIGSFIILLGVGLQAGAANYEMFLAGRFFIGFGMAITIGAAPLLVAEISHPQDRAVLCTFMGVSWFVGSFIASWTTYGTLRIHSDWAWRLPSLLQCVCTLIVIPIMYWVPESPRFYISKDKFEKAKEVLTYYHGVGDDADEFVNLEYHEIYTMLMLDRTLGNAGGYSDFLKTPGNRKRLMLVVFISLFQQWAGGGLIGYYLKIILEDIGINNPQVQLGINGGLRAWALVVNTGLAFFVDRLGRRTIMLVSTIGMLTAFTVWTIMSARHEIGGENVGLAKAIVATIFIYDFFNNFQTGITTTYNLEILPYGLRAKGTTLASLTILIALFFNQFVNPIALENIRWRYYIVYCCFLLFQVWFTWTQVVETRYTPLEEISRFFDGEEKDVVEMTNAHMKQVEVEEGDGPKPAATHIESQRS